MKNLVSFVVGIVAAQLAIHVSLWFLLIIPVYLVIPWPKVEDPQ